MLLLILNHLQRIPRCLLVSCLNLNNIISNIKNMFFDLSRQYSLYIAFGSIHHFASVFHHMTAPTLITKSYSWFLCRTIPKSLSRRSIILNSGHAWININSLHLRLSYSPVTVHLSLFYVPTQTDSSFFSWPFHHLDKIIKW